MEEIHKLDEIRGMVVRLNPSQESCKELIEFMTRFLSFKSNVQAMLSSLHYGEIEREML